MFKKLRYTFLLFLLFCSFTIQAQQEKPTRFSATAILKDHASFWEYCYKYIEFYKTYIALDSVGNVMDKGVFLQQLSTGRFFPLRIDSSQQLFYQLYTTNTATDIDIPITMKTVAFEALRYYQLEGKELPEFDFIDINGKRFSKETTQGKVVLVKCWFIGCAPCVAEIPQLNKLTKSYADKNVEFISVASDNEIELKNFLAKKKFNYAVIANKSKYIHNSLKVSNFPTHIIINRKGIVVKAVNRYDQLEYVLAHEADL